MFNFPFGKFSLGIQGHTPWARIDLVVDFACREEPRDFAVRYIIGLFLADHGHAICDFQTRFET